MIFYLIGKLSAEFRVKYVYSKTFTLTCLYSHTLNRRKVQTTSSYLTRESTSKFSYLEILGKEIETKT